MSDTNRQKTPLSPLLNIAPLYRRPVFERMEEEFECHWTFGENYTDIPSLPTEGFADAVTLPTLRRPKGFYTVKGWRKRIFGKNSPQSVLALGEIKFLPTWGIMFLNLFLPRRKRKRLVLWTHGFYGDEKGLRKTVTRLFFRMADKVLFYSERGRRIAVENGVPENRTDVIFNSLDHDHLSRLRKCLEDSPPSKADLLKKLFADPSLPLFVYIGRLSANKRLTMLVDAASLLRRRGTPVNILFIGEGPERGAIERKASDYDLTDHVALMGECYDESVSAPYLYVADGCVSPGHIGLTAIHSLELGTPVVTHDNPFRHAPEVEAIRPGINGILFREGDVDSLAASMVSLVEMSRRNREKLRRDCVASVGMWTPANQISILRRII